MSIYAKQWAYKQVAGSPGKKAVLVALAEFANGNGEVTAGQSRLSTMTELDTRTIRRHLKALEDDEFIRREHRQREDGARTSDKCVLLAPIEELNPPEPPDKMTGSPPGQNDRKGQSNRTKNTGQPDKMTGVNNELNRQENRQGSSGGDTTNVSYLDPRVVKCVSLLVKTPGWPKSENETTSIVAELIEKFPGADPVQTCDEFEYKFRHEHSSRRPKNWPNALRQFFNTANKQSQNGHAEGGSGVQTKAGLITWDTDGTKRLNGQKVWYDDEGQLMIGAAMEFGPSVIAAVESV